MAKGFTFKREKKQGGLAGVGYPYASVTIKHDGLVVGMIHAPNWQTPDHKWSIALMRKGNENNPNCDWRWVRLKARFDSEEAAREHIKTNAEKILALDLRHEPKEESDE
jgi:hypothetical protein